MKGLYFVLALILVTGVVSNQCPEGRTGHIFKSLKLYNTNPLTGWYKLQDMVYDFQTDSYFYLAYNYGISNNINYISKVDSRGDIIWGKAYSHFPVGRTLRYSPTNQTLYYILSHYRELMLMKVNSLNGEVFNSFKISALGTYSDTPICDLSKNDKAIFCGRKLSKISMALLKFDIDSSKTFVTNINFTYIYKRTVLALSNNEVFYSYIARENSSSYSNFHLVHAKYRKSWNKPIDTLKELYHKSILKSVYYPIFTVDENTKTIWSAFHYRYDTKVYFQYNITDYTLIGSNYTYHSREILHRINAVEGIVCIIMNRELVIINATTRDVIQAYSTLTSLWKNSIDNGYFSFIDLFPNFDNLWSHYQLQAISYTKPIPFMTINSSFVIEKNDFNFVNCTLTIHEVSINTALSVTVSNFEYTLARPDSECFIVSLPDSLKNNISVSPGQNLTFKLPCGLDTYTTNSSCEVEKEDRVTSIIAYDCDKIDIQVKNLTGSDIVSDSFTIDMPLNEKKLSTYFNITYVPCNFTNCESCANGVCDKCSEGYKFEKETLNCEYIIPECKKGFEWKNDTLSCGLIIPECSKGFKWNNDTLSCKLVPEENSDSNQTDVISHVQKCLTYGPKYDRTSLTKISQVLAWIAIFVGFITKFLIGDPTQNSWSIIHYLQIVLVFPLVAISMSEKVKDFIVSNAFAALSLYPLSSCTAKYMPLYFDQPDKYLRVLGWSSGSTFVNNIALLIILIVVGVMHFILSKLADSEIKEDNRLCLWVLKVYKSFSSIFYLRFFIEIYLFTALMVSSEIKYYLVSGSDNNNGTQDEGKENKSRGNFLSLAFSCILLILLLVLLLLSYVSWKRSKDDEIFDDNDRTRELYNGISELLKKCLNWLENKGDEFNDAHDAFGTSLRVKLARLYYMIFFARRLTISLLVIFIPGSVFALKIVFLLPLQIAYLAYAIFVRSFTKTKDRVVETLSEITYLVLLIFLIKYHSKSEWTKIAEGEFIGIIFLQILTLSLVSIISSIIELARFYNIERMSDSERTDSTVINKRSSQDVELSCSKTDQFRRNEKAVANESKDSIEKATNDHDKHKEVTQAHMKFNDKFERS